MPRELTAEENALLDETILAMRRKRIAFDRLARIDELRRYQEWECSMFREQEQRLIDEILISGLDEEWQRRVRKELP